MKLKTEVFGSGLSIFAASYLFYIYDPVARGVTGVTSGMIAEMILKFWVYVLYLIGFNLALRVRHRAQGREPDAPGALKAHIKLTMFFLFMFGVMDAAITIASI